MRKSLLLVLSLGALTLIGCESKAENNKATPAGSDVIEGAHVGINFESKIRERLEEQSPRTLERIDCNQPLSLNDIKAMSQVEMKHRVIISLIEETKSRYELTTAQVIELKNAGVSQKVIDYLINNP